MERVNLERLSEIAHYKDTLATDLFCSVKVQNVVPSTYDVFIPYLPQVNTNATVPHPPPPFFFYNHTLPESLTVIL